jgi:lipoprotein-anchoring transpeptidase ErfK/SrfK
MATDTGTRTARTARTARVVTALAAAAGLAALTGCASTATGSWREAGAGMGAKAPGALSVTAPADAATDVPTATEIALSAGGPATRVTLTDAAGAVVAGDMRPDGSAWVPASQLRYATTYTATVTAGGHTTATRFTTMRRPADLVPVSTPLGDDQVYGVGMPVVVRFDADIAPDRRAAVERRMFVTSSPAQVGAWHWFNGHEVHYRPRQYWLAGTKLSVRVGTGGLPLGGTSYGADDLTLRASIGDKVVMTTDNATKTMTVTRGDQVVRTIPVSLGKPSKPSSSGAMVVMTKAESELFVSTEPGDSYRTTVYWTQRLTWGGQYIHAAPWSVGDQGRRNVSHGCTNMSTENARWLFGITHVGDPVIVKGTEDKLEWGDGWTDWDRSWEEYLEGSALPHPGAGG